MLRPLTDLVDRPSFQVGLVVGAITAVVFVACALVLLSPRRRPLAVAGVGMCAASWLAALIAGVTSPRFGFLALGLLALGAVGAWSVSADARFLTRAALFVPGALLIAPALVPRGETFVRPFLVVFVVFGAAAAIEWPRWEPMVDAGPILMLLAVGGAYLCVPDTEHAALVLGVAIPLACTGWPGRFLSLGAGGAAACVGLLAWVAGTDGSSRPGAVVGAAACLGVLAFVPLLARSGFPLAGSGGSGLRPMAVVVAVQVLVVAACSRLAGLETSAALSVVVAAVALVVGFGAVRMLALPRPRTTRGTVG